MTVSNRFKALIKDEQEMKNLAEAMKIAEKFGKDTSEIDRARKINNMMYFN